MKYFFLFTLLLFITSNVFSSEFENTLKLAKQGDSQAQYELGYMYDEGSGTKENNTEAVKWYLKAAKSGVAGAQYNLALMYENGEGTGKDIQNAITWHTKAALQGNAYAQYSLAYAYEAGEGVEKDIVESFKWYKESAIGGLSFSQFKLATMFADGVGTTKDMFSAYAWMSLANAQETPDSATLLKAIEANLTNAEIQEAKGIVFDNTAIEIKIPDSNIFIRTPYDFAELSPEDIKAKWGERGNDPTWAVGNELLGTTISYHKTLGVMKGDTLPNVMSNLVKVMKRMVAGIEFSKNEIIELNGSDWFLLECNSNALNADIKNMMIGTGVGNDLIMINFNSTKEDYLKYENLLRKSMASVKTAM